MNIEQTIQKSLSKIKSDEKGWQKVIAEAEGSYSREFAQENLRRLDGQRRSLLNQLESSKRRRKHVMREAIDEGIFTDHESDGVCEQLLGEGWLERAAPIPLRRRVTHAPVYLPTERAVQDWNAELS